MSRNNRKFYLNLGKPKYGLSLQGVIYQWSEAFERHFPNREEKIPIGFSLTSASLKRRRGLARIQGDF